MRGQAVRRSRTRPDHRVADWPFTARSPVAAVGRARLTGSRELAIRGRDPGRRARSAVTPPDRRSACSRSGQSLTSRHRSRRAAGTRPAGGRRLGDLAGPSGAGGRRSARPAPPAVAQARSTRPAHRGRCVASADASSAVAARAPARAPPRRSVQRVQVLGHQLGGPGQRGSHPPPSTSSSSGSTSRRSRTRVNAGSALCGSCHGVRAGRRGRRPRCPPGARRAAAGPRAGARPHPGDRPRPRSAGQAEQHGLGLVVGGVAEQHRRITQRTATTPRALSYRARRAAASRPPSRPPSTVSTRVRRSRCRRSCAAHGPRPGRRSRPAVRGRRWPRSPAGRAASASTPTARASESAPPEQATISGPCRCVGGQPERAGRPHAAAALPTDPRVPDAWSAVHPADPGGRVGDLRAGRQRLRRLSRPR